jgi:hypothetical protein
VQKYPVRADHRARLTLEDLAALCRSVFGEADQSTDVVTTKFGALARLAVRPEKRELWVDVTMDPKVPIEVASETVRRYNQFLEGATGYSAKERARRLRKAATAAAE